MHTHAHTNEETGPLPETMKRMLKSLTHERRANKYFLLFHFLFHPAIQMKVSVNVQLLVTTPFVLEKPSRMFCENLLFA